MKVILRVIHCVQKLLMRWYKELNAEEENKQVEKIKASDVTVEKGATLAMILKKYHQVHFFP